MLEILDLSLLVVAGAYLIGSLSSAIILCKLAGLSDPRSQGSGNPGATNVLRFGGKKLAATVLLLDVVKGRFPVVIARLLGLDLGWLAQPASRARPCYTCDTCPLLGASNTQGQHALGTVGRQSPVEAAEGMATLRGDTDTGT